MRALCARPLARPDRLDSRQGASGGPEPGSVTSAAAAGLRGRSLTTSRSRTRRCRTSSSSIWSRLIAARPIASRPIATAPSAVAPTAKAPIAVGPRRPGPRASTAVSRTGCRSSQRDRSRSSVGFERTVPTTKPTGFNLATLPSSKFEVEGPVLAPLPRPHSSSRSTALP